MNKPTKKTLSLAALGSLVLVASSAHGTTVLNSIDATWPGTTGAQTVDVFTADPSPGSRGVSGTRQLRQTFQVSSTFTVRSVYLSATNYNNLAFKINIYEVDDIDATTWSAGTLVKSLTVDSFGSTATGNQNLEILLTGADQFELARRNTGDQGYGMELVLVDTSSATAAFGWASTTGQGDTVPGRFYRETGAIQPVDIESGLALVAVPEPRAALLGGLGLLALLRRRRN